MHKKMKFESFNKGKRKSKTTAPNLAQVIFLKNTSFSSIFKGKRKNKITVSKISV